MLLDTGSRKWFLRNYSSRLAGLLGEKSRSWGFTRDHALSEISSLVAAFARRREESGPPSGEGSYQRTGPTSPRLLAKAVTGEQVPDRTQALTGQCKKSFTAVDSSAG